LAWAYLIEITRRESPRAVQTDPSGQPADRDEALFAIVLARIRRRDVTPLKHLSRRSEIQSVFR